jgi:hypothetical protein
MHSKIHTGIKIPCDYPECLAAFTSKCDLTKHKRIHTTEGIARQKKEEQRIARALEAANIDFKREHRVDFQCINDVYGKYASIDFLMVRNGHLVLIEVDENQHKFGHYSIGCDLARVGKIVESLVIGGFDMPITMLRYNPNAFKIDGTTQKFLKKNREGKLISILTFEHNQIYSNKPLSIMYMNYDCNSEGRPSLLDSDEYSESMKECVITMLPN